MWQEKDGNVLIIKNAKTLYTLLNRPNAAGDTAKYIKEAMPNYCEFHRDGQKYIITEVYALPKEVISKGSRTIYADKCEDVLLYYLTHNHNENEYFTNKSLWEKMGLINKSYLKYDNDRISLCKYLVENGIVHYDENTIIHRIFNAYDIIYDKIRQITKSALCYMERRKTIECSPVYFINFYGYTGTHILKKGDLFYDYQERFLTQADEYARGQVYLNSDFMDYEYNNKHSLYRSHDNTAIKQYEGFCKKYSEDLGRKVRKLIDIKPLVSISIDSNHNALNRAILNQLVLKSLYDEVEKWLSKHANSNDTDRILLRQLVTILVSGSTEQVNLAIEGQDITPFSAEELSEDF